MPFDLRSDDSENSDEPEEFDPEDRWGDAEEELDRWGDPEAKWNRWGDPERDLPNVPEAPKPATPEGEVDSELKTTFWVSVVLVNVGVGALSLGAMFVYFRGQWRLGGGLVVVGLFLLLRTYQRYQQFREKRASKAAETTTTDDDPDAEKTYDGNVEAIDDDAESDAETTESDAGDGDAPDDPSESRDA
ncbi:hypothetical protein AUR64_09250 [Haloprofundus marisrubri]|uniref:DUF7322 domain-containing protein n=1 Tax=Haloprofundus marisrubri TaxID=1514971 RepID=A0A0W1R8T6_9EURY|nr:hypothetical protein [Haloprofundus marisrubri]KTG09809.1 hypothetical protein AUR64_09250 [Haloprofundus marisrubri]